MKTLKLFLILTCMLALFANVSAATISITPSVAYTNDNLACSVDVNPGAYIYKWYLGDQYKKTGQTLEASYTEPGQAWTCKVFFPPTPYTTAIFIGQASRLISETIVIPVNNIPTIPAISLSGSGVYYIDSTITATATSTDADNDPITYEYRFERAGTSLSTTDTLDCSGVCVKNDVIDVFARAYDGKNYSAWNSTSVTISNSAPTTLIITYTPAVIYSNSTINVSAGATDIDGDLISYDYRFYNMNDSVVLQAYSLSNTYTFDSSSENDTVQISVMAYDGSVSTSNAVYVNVLPVTTNNTNGTNGTNVTFNYCPVNSSNFPIRISEVTNQDSIESNEFNPLEEFKIKVKVENTADESKNVYVKAIIVSNNKSVADTEVSEEVKVGSESTKTVELNMTVPMDLKEGSYDLYIKVYDESNRSNCEEKVIRFDVVRDDHSIAFKDVEFSPSDTVSCGDLLTLSGVLANIGATDEEKVKITYEDDMKNKLEEVVNNLDWGDESRTIEFYPAIPTNATEGKHKVTLTIYYDYNDGSYDKKSASVNYYFTVSGGCKKITIIPTTNITTNITTTQPTTAGFSFSDFISNNWKSILMITEIVVVFFVVLKILLVSKLI